MRARWIGVGGAAVVAGLYLTSLFLPAYSYERTTYTGWQAFCDALAAFIVCVTEGGQWTLLSGWLPNPLLWAGVVCLLLGFGRAAALAGITAILLAVATWGLRGLFLGYYLWLLSMLLLVSAGFAMAFSAGRKESPGSGVTHSQRLEA